MMFLVFIALLSFVQRYNMTINSLQNRSFNIFQILRISCAEVDFDPLVGLGMMIFLDLIDIIFLD